MYDSLAIIYDSFTDDIDYDRWADDIENAIKEYSAFPVKTVADLACGTGSISVRLAKRGYSVTGVDISGEMLLRAAENMRKAGTKCNFVRQDMTQLKLHKKVDAIACACDGINYLTQDGQINEFFSSCYDGLKSGGIFVFDVSSDEKLKQVLGNNSYFDIREDACFFWQNSVDGNKVTMELNIFLEQEDGRYVRKTETQVQRMFTKDEIENALNGFEILEVKSVSYDSANEDKRLQFVCRKKEI